MIVGKEYQFRINKEEKIPNFFSQPKFEVMKGLPVLSIIFENQLDS